MTAIELADSRKEWANDLLSLNEWSIDAETMLRQQQAEIEALKAEIVAIEKNTDYWADKNSWIKNNEPVAWMHKESGQVFAGMGSPIKPDDFIPLYTHPADRIAELEQALENIIAISDRKHDAWDKAKELLKKASEK